MGCGSSSTKAVSPTPQKPLQSQNGAPVKNHSNTQSNLKQSKETNSLCHATKEGKCDNNGNEKPKIKPETNQDYITATENQENNKNLLNSSKLNGKYGIVRRKLINTSASCVQLIHI